MGLPILVSEAEDRKTVAAGSWAAQQTNKIKTTQISTFYQRPKNGFSNWKILSVRASSNKKAWESITCNFKKN